MKDSRGKPAGLAALRERIDVLDAQLLELLAQRMQVVSEVAAFKRQHGVAIRDYARERQLLDERARMAGELGLNPGPVESIYRQIMLASRDYQASLGAAVPVDVQPKRVVVVGGEGAMGQLLCRMFGELGHAVVSADRHTAPSPEAAVASADVVVISVPIDATVSVIRELGPLVRSDALLMDVTSVKQGPLDAMLEASSASVVGTHPMFGPGVHTLQGQRVVLCPGRGDAWLGWLERALDARGLVVTRASAEEHDRAMALVQVLTHFQTQVLGLALARSGQSLEASRRFTSPAYLMELYVAARHFAQDAALYGPIEMLNPETARVTATFRKAAEELAQVLADRDQARFEAIFREVREFFGDFTAEAVEQSSFLIDRLVERSMG